MFSNRLAYRLLHDCKKAGFTAEQVLAERLKRSKPVMDRIKEKFERFAKSSMFSVIESCNMNKLSPGGYIKELVSRLTAKPCNDVKKRHFCLALYKNKC